MEEKKCYNLSKEKLKKILDNIYNEIYVTSKDLKILYVNKKSVQHYNLSPKEMIGKNHMKFANKYWSPTIQPLVLKEKRRMCVEQITSSGETIISTATPVLDENKNLKIIVSVVQEKFKKLDLNIKENEENNNFLILRNKQIDNFNFITRSKKMEYQLKLSRKAAKSNLPILIQGASGTGKSILAKYIHNHSSRKEQPFLSLNCSVIPENLIESELFGYVPNAFTGANPKGKKGLISSANNGTLFLDEIGELPLHLQSKLLNIVENCQFIPIGGCKPKNINIRIISATNKNLKNLVKEKKFREDLFWRLNIIEIFLPQLVDRPEDIIPITNLYLNLYNKKYSKNKFFDEKSIEKFLTYNWPGNIRQLKNTVERIFVLSQKPKITVDSLPKFLLTKNLEIFPKKNLTFDEQLEILEKRYILKLFVKHNTPEQMAKILKISLNKASKLIKKYCIQ